jgi:hypothetical protein
MAELWRNAVRVRIASGPVSKLDFGRSVCSRVKRR